MNILNNPKDSIKKSEGFLENLKNNLKNDIEKKSKYESEVKDM